MRKRLCSILLCFSLLLSALPAAALASDTAEPGETPAVPVETVTRDVHTSIVLTDTVPETLPTMTDAMAAIQEQTGTAANQDIIFDYLTGVMGLNAAAAAGIVANIYCESGFQADIYGDAGTSYGICQWHNGRFTALRSWCDTNGYDYTTLEGQLPFLHHELQVSYPNIWNYVSSVPETAEGAYDAAYYWCKYFEVPADTENKARQRGQYAAEQYWPQYAHRQTAALLARTDANAYVLDQDAVIWAESVGQYTGLTASIHRLNDENQWQVYYEGACPAQKMRLTLRGEGIYRLQFSADFDGQTLQSNAVTFLVAEHLWDMTLLKPSAAQRNGAVYCRCSHCGAEEIRDVFEPDHDMAPCPSARFEDVPTDAWYHGGVDYVLANYIYNGSGLTTFAPEEEMTRAALLRMFWRMSGSPESVAEQVFDDIPDDADYAAAVDWAVANGIAEGVSEGSFAPEQTLNRAEAAELFYRYALYCGSVQYARTDLSVYPDAEEVSEELESVLQWAVGAGIACDPDSLTLTRLALKEPFTRSQAAVWCRNLANAAVVEN